MTPKLVSHGMLDVGSSLHDQLLGVVGCGASARLLVGGGLGQVPPVSCMNILSDAVWASHEEQTQVTLQYHMELDFIKSSA